MSLPSSGTDASSPIAASTPPPSCELYDLVLDMNWHRVYQHVKQHPQDAAYLDGDTWETPLYVACQYGPPVRVVRALLQACPDAMTQISRRLRYNALLMACRSQASLAVLNELLQYRTETLLQRTRFGSTALTTLWEGRDTVGRHDYGHASYQSNFWQKVRAVLTAMAKEQERQYKNNKRDTTISCAREEDEEQMDVATDTNDNAADDDEELFMVHVAVSLGPNGCPREILDFCLHEYPQQVRQPDSQGCLPLHIAVGGGAMSGGGVMGVTPPKKRSWRKLYLKYRTVHGQAEQTILTRLLQLYPQAALVPVPLRDNKDKHDVETDTTANCECDGHVLPLHMALRQGTTWEEGIRELWNAAPTTLAMMDPQYRFYPFQLAAAAPPEQECDKKSSKSSSGHINVDLDTVYRLLRSDPAVLKLACHTSRKRPLGRVEGSSTPTKQDRKMVNPLASPITNSVLLYFSAAAAAVTAGFLTSPRK